MTKEQYAKQRAEMMAAIEEMIGKGENTEAQAKMKEVEELDNKFEETKLANANLEALKAKTTVTDLENKSQSVEGGTVVEKTNDGSNVMSNEALYEAAWAKQVLMGQKIDGKELEVFNKMNGGLNNFTHTTENSPILIPESVVAGIWKRAEEEYPLFGDVKKYNVTGTLKIKKFDTIVAGDADWYEEGTPTVDEQDTFAEMSLGGHELAKLVKLSWKLKSMGVQGIIQEFTEHAARRIGVELGNSVARGNGTTQPEGVETALKAEADTPQVVNGLASFENIATAISLVHSSYLNGAKFYVNSAMVYGPNGLARILDGNDRPYFVTDTTGGFRGYMLGFPVVADAGVSPGTILFGNASRGYVFNTNEPLSVTTGEDVKQRESLYSAYTVVDGGVLDTKAFALIDGVVPTP